MYKKTDKKAAKKQQKEAASGDGLRNPAYTEIVNGIIEAIEKGADTFQMPWNTIPKLGFPINAHTRNFYRGVNWIWLSKVAADNGFERSLWATYIQWKQHLKAQVRAGEQGTKIVFFKPVLKDEAAKSAADTAQNEVSEADEADKIDYFICVAHTLFNVLQVDGYEELPQLDSYAVKPDLHDFVANTGAKIIIGGTSACYRPNTDAIYVPALERFTDTGDETPEESAASTILHELVHWSGAKHRLHRDFSGRFGTAAYSFEELVAELGAAFLCNDLQVSITPRPSHAQYIASWIKVLKGDPKALFTAARLAQQAVDYLHDLQPKPAAEPPVNAIMPTSNVGT